MSKALADKLFRTISLSVYGHDKAVLQSYTTFVKNACSHLGIESSNVVRGRYIRWIQYALRAKFAKKKYKLHYETRSYNEHLSISNVTGSTATTFLEYVQRNIPEGVAMKVTYEERSPLLEAISGKTSATSSAPDAAAPSTKNEAASTPAS